MNLSPEVENYISLATSCDVANRLLARSLRCALTDAQVNELFAHAEQLTAPEFTSKHISDRIDKKLYLQSGEILNFLTIVQVPLYKFFEYISAQEYSYLKNDLQIQSIIQYIFYGVGVNLSCAGLYNLALREIGPITIIAAVSMVDDNHVLFEIEIREPTIGDYQICFKNFYHMDRL